MVVDGINVRMALRFGQDDIRIMKISEHGHATWHSVEPAVDPGVTFQVSHDFGRALLDALLRYYQGASDMHTARADLLHERKRVDGLISTLSYIAAGGPDASA